MNTPAPTIENSTDIQHLRLLTIFHYVLAGLLGLACVFFVFYIAMGVAMVTGHWPDIKQSDRMMGWFFIFIGAFYIVSGSILGGYMIYAARCLKQQRRPLLCMIVAGFSCFFMPFGTVLGVFTIIVLQRPSVKALFAANSNQLSI